MKYHLKRVFNLKESHMSQFQKFKQLIQEFLPDSQLLKIESLTGGISTQTTKLEVKLSDGSKKKFVVRQHGERDRASNPNIARDEFKLLQALYQSDVPTAKPYHVSDDVFDYPCIVLEYIEGQAEFTPENLENTIKKMADALISIHSIPNAETTFDFLPAQSLRYTYRLKNPPAKIDESLSEGQIRDALKSVWELPEVNERVLLHGDYWAGNVLWKKCQLVAAIDWEDAMLGDPLADLGDSRIAILWSFGREAMTQFTEHYQSKMHHLDYRYLPYWDLCATLRPISQFSNWANNADHEKMMRREHHWLVNQALSKIN